MDVADVCAAIRECAIAQISNSAADIDQLLCDGKTIRGSIEPISGGGLAFIAQVTLYSGPWGWRSLRPATPQLRTMSVLCSRSCMGELDPEWVLIQADALHMQQPSLVYTIARPLGLNILLSITLNFNMPAFLTRLAIESSFCFTS